MADWYGTHLYLQPASACISLVVNYKTPWTTRSPAKPQPEAEDQSVALWQEKHCWVELLSQCLSSWLKWLSLSDNVLLNSISCIIQSLSSTVKQQCVTLSSLLAVVVCPHLQYCSPELKLFSVISVRGLSLPRQMLNNRAYNITTARCEMLLNPSIMSVLFIWRGKEKEGVIWHVIHFHQRLLRILLLLRTTVFRSPE